MAKGNMPDTRGKTPEQVKAIKYFFASGCLSGAPKDGEYDELLKKLIAEINPYKKALNKIGLDEEELKEIPPVHFCGYEFDKAYSKIGKDGRSRSSRYSDTWLFFSATQVYMYSIIFDTTSADKKERTEEYFYKDVTNFSTSTDTVEVTVHSAGGCMKKESVSKKQIESSYFSLIVPGDKFSCSTMGSSNVDESIRGMKAKLREKKM